MHFLNNNPLIRKLLWGLLVVFGFGGLFLIIRGGFIQNADFRFPLEPKVFVEKHLSVWSFQNGSINLDGVIRFFVRLPLIVVFLITRSNIATSYFFIITSLLFGIFSMRTFLRSFLNLNNSTAVNIGSLLFAISTAYLGNLSKLGLIFAAFCLPLILTLIKKIFTTRNVFPYAIGIVILINFSFIHPFTLFVNIIFSVVYIIYNSINELDWLLSKWKQILISLGLVVLLNFYILINILVFQSVDKALISNSIGADAGGLNLLNIAVTENIFEAFTQSKSVFIDFNYYNESNSILFFGIYFVFYYTLLILLFITTRKVRSSHKKYTYLFSILVCLFVLLGFGSTNPISSFIYFILELTPFFWFFRSPLKWQLYIPVFLIPVIVLAIKNSLAINQKRYSKVSFILIVLLLLSNFNLYAEIFNNLIKPNQFNYTNSLSNIDLDNKKVLFVNSPECGVAKKEYTHEFEELMYLFQSKNNQFKILNKIEFNENVKLFSQFDYILSCADIGANKYEFLENIFNDTEKGFQINVNNFATKKLSTTPELLVIPENRLNNQELEYIIESDEETIQNISFTDISYKNNPSYIRELFNINSSVEVNNNTKSIKEVFQIPNIQDPSIDVASFFTDLSYTFENNQLNLYQNPIGELFINENKVLENEKILIASEAIPSNVILIDSQELILESQGVITASRDTAIEIPTFENEYAQLDIKKPNLINISSFIESGNSNYIEIKNQNFQFDNLIDNGSFEEGLWKKEVDDCFNYDSDPVIDIALESNITTDGKNALKLSSTRHKGCTFKNISIEENSSYNLSFDYYTINNNRFGVEKLFSDPNDESKLLRDEIVITSDDNEEWFEYNSIIESPDTEDFRLTLSTFETDRQTKNDVIFDNFKIQKIPELKNKLFVVNNLPDTVSDVKISNVKRESPNKITADISNLNSNNFVLRFHESYNPKWNISIVDRNKNPINATINQVKVDTIENAWSVEINDNSITEFDTFNVSIKFTPQRWFNFGLLVSGLTFMLMIGYLAYEYWKRHYQIQWLGGDGRAQSNTQPIQNKPNTQSHETDSFPIIEVSPNNKKFILKNYQKPKSKNTYNKVNGVKDEPKSNTTKVHL